MVEQEQSVDPSLAMEELAWRFHSAEAAIGIRAQDVLPQKGNTVFDELASHEAHMKLREERHRWAVNRMRGVDATLWAISAPSRAALTLAFTPGGRVSQRVASHFELAFGAQRASILGFALCSRAMHTAWRIYHPDVAMPDTDQLLVLVDKASPDTLKGIMRGALAELQPAIDEYAEAREVRLVIERSERDRKRQIAAEYGDARMRDTREKLWGKP